MKLETGASSSPRTRGCAGAPDTLWASADLGTNTFRLLIADEVEPGALCFRELHQQVVRLGEGLDGRGRLLPEAVERARSLLLRFRSRLDTLGVTRRAGGLTAAGRDAADGLVFCDQASELLGGPVRVLGGEEEARLSAAGALSLVDLGSKDVLFVDIGGGSTEVVSVKSGRTEVAVSLPIGVVKLFESARETSEGGAGGLLDASARQAAASLPGTIDAEAWGEAFARGDAVFLATAGTPLTVAAEVRGRSIADTRSLSGTVVALAEVAAVRAGFVQLSTEERAALASVEPGREDVILAGLALLTALMERVRAPAFTVSDGGLLEGVLLDCVARERGVARWVQSGVPG